MTKLKSNAVVKVLAVILLTALTVVAAYCGLGAIYINEVGGYTQQVNSFEDTVHYNSYRLGYLSDNYYNFYEQAFEVCYPLADMLPLWAAIAVLLALALLIYLFYAAGHRKGVEGIARSPLERVPLDLLTAVVALLCIGGLLLLWDLPYWGWNAAMMLSVPLATVLVLLVVMFLLSVVIRFKHGSWWQNTIIYRCWRLLVRIVKFLWAPVRTVFTNLPLLWKVILFFAGFALLNYTLLHAGYWSSGALFLWFLLIAFCGLVLCNLVVQLSKLQKAAQDLADGKENTNIDMRQMYRDLRKHGQNLNSISLGISRAVEARMKSERMRTELIANVSHDIKTPLTSIINYIDLLKKEDIANETAVGYIEVIDRQSARLKKLTEDVIEVSKVSTGNVTVNAVPTNVVELLDQSIAEYQDRFIESNLTPVFTRPEEEAMISADGRLMWRVFDNLLNNVCKYSQPYTRVYIAVTVIEGYIHVELKNISREVLNINPDELMARFVRGDAARNSEGSGLGLSITQSLVQLQKGKFSLQVDGDLFKAVLTFDRLVPVRRPDPEPAR